VNGTPPPGPHGGDGRRVATALGLDPRSVLDLSVSLNPFAPNVAVLAARYLTELRHYPDPARATAALAGAIGVEPRRVLLTNGGSEAIALVANLLGGGVAAEPEFSLHPRGGTGPRWRSNPHNPSGRLAAVVDRAGVWDEAFYPLAAGAWTRGDAERGAVVVGSLTKVFACPGLRVGYVLAPDADTATRLRRSQPEWSVNGLAAALVPDLVERADLTAWSRRIGEQRAELVRVLHGHGFEPEPSDANWVLVPAPGLRDLLAPWGVVVRDCASFGLPDHVRIAVPDDEGLAGLDRALAATAG
jgi:histidinol-phosphate/aromatic aminotransferase/cobyric acid decarboxylase-like protein